MPKELEIKLSVMPEHLSDALGWLKQQNGVSEQQSRQLANIYYDTPGGDLNRERVALRVRQSDGQFIQTLKTQGEFIHGAHHRNEWEWLIPGKTLDLSLIESVPAPAHINWKLLEPVFETNFVRQVLLIEHDDTEIEVAVDSGEIVAGRHTLPLNEIEFELKKGDPSALVRWTGGLAREVPIFLNLISKAEQGYYLAGLRNKSEVVSEESPITVIEFLNQLSDAWLRNTGCDLGEAMLRDVQEVAKRLGMAETFEEVLAELKHGVTVRDLASNHALGQLQLAIASAESDTSR